MGIDPKPVRYTGLKCSDCFTTFEILSGVGPCTLCGECASRRSRELLSDVPSACGYHVLPVAGDAVTCGLRADRPKKQRRHERVSLGMDTRSLGEAGFFDVEIFACMECGRDSKGSSSDPSAVKVSQQIPVPLATIMRHIVAHGCTHHCLTRQSMIRVYESQQ